MRSPAGLKDEHSQRFFYDFLSLQKDYPLGVFPLIKGLPAGTGGFLLRRSK